MSAQEQMKKMLDELMGTKRDGENIEDGKTFTDSDVCKSFIMGLCPFDLFHNTKLDLGPCHKYHSLALKADFEQASKNRDYGYDVDQLDHLKSFVRDCDRKVEANKKRLEDNNEEETESNEATSVHELNEQIGKLLAKSEELGAEGKVDESFALTKEVEELKAEKRKAEDAFRSSLPVTGTQQQKLRVCEICGAYLSLYDNDRRLADHFGGKLHMGFIKIRDRLAELQESVSSKREAREKEREKKRQEREKAGSPVDRRNSSSREGSQRRDHSRERSRERRRDRSRSKDRDRRRVDQGYYRDRRGSDRRDYDRYDRRDYGRRDYDRGRRDSERDRYQRRERYRNRSNERYDNRDVDRNGERRMNRDASPCQEGNESKGLHVERKKMINEGKGSDIREDGEIDSAADSNVDEVAKDKTVN
eukprot:gene2631-3045_t